MDIRPSAALTALLLLFLIGLPVQPLQAASLAADPLNPELLQQKVVLMERMLENSSSSGRIHGGDSTLAKERLNHARDHVNVAKQALADNQFQPASEKIKQAMTFYSAAAATVADATDKGDAQRTRFNELSVSVESFRLYVQKAVVQSNEANPLDPQQLSSLMQLAAELAQHQNYSQANDVLNEAYMLTITAVSALKGGTTIVYSNELETPEQQYRYELERYKGLIQLYQMVIPDGKLPKKFSWTQKSLTSSEAAYDKAAQLASMQDYPQALEQIDQAAKKLSQILRLLGLPIS